MVFVLDKIYHDQKVGEGRFIWLTLPHHSSQSKDERTGTQAGRILEAAGDAEATEKQCLLTCSHGLLSLFFIHPEVAPGTRGCTPTSITN